MGVKNKKKFERKFQIQFCELIESNILFDSVIWLILLSLLLSISKPTFIFTPTSLCSFEIKNFSHHGPPYFTAQIVSYCAPPTGVLYAAPVQ